jgi:Response regulator containing a CheY-like receiver domain and an HTH DNA-binding domain
MLARDDLDGSLNALQNAENERKNRLLTPFVHSLVEVTWVQVWLKQGNWTQLDQWERNQVSNLESSAVSNDPIDEYLELRLIMLVRLWIEKTKLDKNEERFGTGFSLLERLDENSRKLGRGNSLAVVLLYKAIILFHKDRRDEASKELDNCFELAEPGEYMRIFLDVGDSSRALIYAYLQQSDVNHKDYALHILREFSNSQKEENQKKAPSDVLTSRETEILQLLAEGCSNRKIAERLVLSEGTIKFHIHNILGKLNATSRTMAITKARELNLI